MKKIKYILLFFWGTLLSPSRIFAHNPDDRVKDGEKVLAQYEWFEYVNFPILLTLIIVYMIYLTIIKKYEVVFKDKLWFFLGLFVTYSALAGPIAILSNNLVFSAHMLQQSLMYLVMPPLLLLGLPKGFLEDVWMKLSIIKVFKLITAPLVTLLLFNTLWSFYHIPIIYESIWHHFWLLETTHVVLNLSAFLMWIHVVAASEQVSRLSGLQKIGYMFANGVLITPACALIIFSGDVIYSLILDAPTVWQVLTPIDDQQLGGIIMKVIQEFMYSSIIAVAFFRWARQEREKDKTETEHAHLHLELNHKN